jgi:hypothetical protein
MEGIAKEGYLIAYVRIAELRSNTRQPFNAGLTVGKLGSGRGLILVALALFSF